jgi:hypothetical protein
MSFLEKVRCLAFDDLAQDGDEDYDAHRMKLEDARQELLFLYRQQDPNKQKSKEYAKALKNFREAWYNVFKARIPVNSEERYLKALMTRKYTNNSPLKVR